MTGGAGQTSSKARAAFPIVAIGASAGGLEAFRELLSALESDTGMAFVLLLHLPATHDSKLSEILERVCSLPILEVQERVALEPNHIYVLPGGSDLEIDDHSLTPVRRQAAAGQHRPIDHFFTSLAEHEGDCAIGVVLSGTASDGSLGIQEIKAAGGITFAQDDTAQHSSMPRSAIATGSIDFVLSARDIAHQLARIAKHPLRKARVEAQSFELQPIIQILRESSGVDFQSYKPNTLYRRIARRIVLNKLDSIEAYVQLLKSNAAEAEALFQDILINVTSFFRNPEAFEALKTEVFPKVIENRSRHDPVRIWTLACSTGEEAYSIAMAYAEFIESNRILMPVQIFATDLNGTHIDRARQGIYARSSLQDVSEERISRFFVKIDGHYRVAKSIRDCCVFARHNALTDPPFSRIDLVSCRNLLIYLGQETQQKAIPTIHYALRRDGFLWLGNSETIGAYRDLFELKDPKYKIYLRRSPGGEPVLPVLEPRASVAFGSTVPLPETAATRDPQREAERLLLARFAPPSVLVRGDLEILQYRGNTSPYLAPAPGRASLNLLKMLREGLVMGVRSAIERAKSSELPVRAERLRIDANGEALTVDVEVIPVRSGSSRAELFMVVFDAAAPAGSRLESNAVVPVEGADGAEILKLRQELSATREYLQSVIEQQEAANEELQSANEEVQSANEELQSINEELETSKEEVQSSNEELMTVNDELQARNAELARSNDDFVNLLTSVQIPIVMLDASSRIRRYTPSAEKLLNLIPTDLGRPISHINLNLDLSDLADRAREVIETVTPYEREVRDMDEHGYLLRIRPYRTLENRIDGAVIALVDVDSLRRSQEEVRRQAEESKRVLQRVADDLVAADRRKDEFLAMLAHELRNPLAPLQNVVGFLKVAGVNPPDRERALGIMDRQIQNMSRLIDDLLNVSRITLSQIELRTETIEVAALIGRVTEQFDTNFRSRRQSLHASLPREAVYVNADPVRLEQIIGNLLDNASKYSETGGKIQLSVRLEAVGKGAPHAGMVAISVKDDGIGIEREKLPHVFELFMRATRSIDQKYGGLGVGLTLVKRLAEAHGGSVLALSEGPGKGSEFILRLPMVNAPISGGAPKERVRRPNSRALRILVVDDSVDNVETLAMALREHFNAVTVAHSGAKALEIAATYKPDVAIIDIGMPEMDGFEVARRLRSLDACADAKLIALSGYGQANDRKRGRDASFDEYLVKPVSIDAILELLWEKK